MKRTLLALLVASACERAETAPKTRPVPTARAVQGGALADGPFWLAEGAARTLAVDDGVQIALRGPAHYQVSGEQLLAQGGLVSVDIAARHAAQRPFGVATPFGQVELPFAARLVLYGRELAVVSGEAALGKLRVGAKTRVCLGGVPQVASQPGFATVEAAQAGLPSSHACEREPPPALATLERELAAQLDQFARAKDDQELLIQQASTRPDLVLRLAQLGQRLLETRTRVIALRAQLGAAQLGAPASADRSALLTRASALEPQAR